MVVASYRLNALCFFVHEYPEKAQGMMSRNAKAGGTRYPFPVACINVMRMMVKLLMLDEAPASTSRLILHSDSGPDTMLKMQVSERVSRTTFWRVFDDPKSFEKLHSMAFMLLDLHWTRSGATQMGFHPVLDSTRRQMGWLLEQAPKSVEEMWKTWMQVRQTHAKKFSAAVPFSNPNMNHEDAEEADYSTVAGECNKSTVCPTEELAAQMAETLKLQQTRRTELLRTKRLEEKQNKQVTSVMTSNDNNAENKDDVEKHKSPIKSMEDIKMKTSISCPETNIVSIASDDTMTVSSQVSVLPVSKEVENGAAVTILSSQEVVLPIVHT